MAEPTTVLAVTGAATSTVAVVATALGVPAPVVLASTLGAAAAVMQSPRVSLTAWVLAAMVTSFGVSIGLGIWGGGFAGHVLVGLINGLVPKAQLAPNLADPICTIVIALVGQSRLLPIVLGYIDRKAGGNGQ